MQPDLKMIADDYSSRLVSIYYLSEGIDVWGNHTGYTQLPSYMRRLRPDIHHFQIRGRNKLTNFLGRFTGNHNIRQPRQNYRNLYEWYFYYFYTRRLRPGSIYHLVNFDSSYPFLTRLKEVPKRLIFTFHSPNLEGMTAEYKAYMARIKSAIVLYRQDVEWYESFVGNGRVKFAYSGVDTKFFHPQEMTRLPERPRLLFVGRVLRDTAMLARIIQTLTRTSPQVQFDLIVTAFQRAKDPHIRSLAHLPSVTFHTAIPDTDLRWLYQQSYLLLLPLTNAAANNAIVEALASGLPIITNQVGGVVDYGGGTIYPVVPAEDDAAMLALIERYLSDFKWRNDIAAAGREFAVSHLAWPIVAEKHYEIYKELCL